MKSRLPLSGRCALEPHACKSWLLIPKLAKLSRPVLRRQDFTLMLKPFSFEKLLTSSKRRIRYSNEAQAELTLVYGEAALDLLTPRVTAVGMGHGFTLTESTTFEFLTLHPGQVISREQLLSRAWRVGLDPAGNVLGIYIRYIRREPCYDLIHTVCWASYVVGRLQLGSRRNAVGGHVN